MDKKIEDRIKDILETINAAEYVQRRVTDDNALYDDLGSYIQRCALELTEVLQEHYAHQEA